MQLIVLVCQSFDWQKQYQSLRGNKTKGKHQVNKIMETTETSACTDKSQEKTK